MSDEEMSDADLGLLKRHIAQLGEHFDCIQVFATRNDAETERTVAVQTGNGNWFARYGQVKEWVVKEERRMQIELEREEAE